MGDFLGMLEKLKDSWQEWRSTPYIFGVLAIPYGWFSFNMGDVLRFKGILFLGLFCLSLFLLYIFLCANHTHQKKVQESSDENKKSGKKKFYIAGICIFSLLSLISILVFGFTMADKDGKYVIWADEYQIALTHNVHKSYYLQGAEVVVHKKELDDYSVNSVFDLDFKNDGTFTMAYEDKLLGVTPGYNGVGYSSSNTSTSWKLVKVADDVYYILNVDENTYLKWYVEQQNWTTHPNISERNQGEFLLRLERID